MTKESHTSKKTMNTSSNLPSLALATKWPSYSFLCWSWNRLSEGSNVPKISWKGTLFCIGWNEDFKSLVSSNSSNSIFSHDKLFSTEIDSVVVVYDTKISRSGDYVQIQKESSPNVVT